jgi:excisionase family DNA binding protein
MTATVHDDLLTAGTVTVNGAVAEFQISKSRLYELMQRGELTYSQFGGRRLIPRIALRRLIAAGMVGVKAEDGAK